MGKVGHTDAIDAALRNLKTLTPEEQRKRTGVLLAKVCNSLDNAVADPDCIFYQPHILRAQLNGWQKASQGLTTKSSGDEKSASYALNNAADAWFLLSQREVSLKKKDLPIQQALLPIMKVAHMSAARQFYRLARHDPQSALDLLNKYDDYKRELFAQEREGVVAGPFNIHKVMAKLAARQAKIEQRVPV